MGVIYKITSPNGREYVGKTWNLRKRINAHRASLTKKNTYHMILINSFRKYGFDEHIFEVIEECEEDVLAEREIYWIKELNTFNGDNPFGMNMTLGGEGQRGKLDERRKAIAINNLYKNGIPFKGMHHTAAFKKEKSLSVSKWNLENNHTIPKWGVEKGRLAIIVNIVCYNVNGIFLREFESQTEAASFFNMDISSINSALRRNSCVKGEYYIKRKTDNYPLKIETKGKVLLTSKRKVLYLDSNLKVIKEYPSAHEVSAELGISRSTVNTYARDASLKPTKLGHIFIYKDLWDNNDSVNPFLNN